MKKVLLYSTITLAVLAIIIWKLNANKSENAAKTKYVKESNSGAIPVLVTTVEKTSLSPEFSANGNFVAGEQIDFASESSGRIVELMVEEGTDVRKDQVLARIDNQVVTAELSRAEANVNVARTNVDRYRKALETGGVTQKQVDDIEVAYEDAVARLTQAKKNMQNTLLRAPINGIINARYVEVGAYLSPGTKLFEIVNISTLKLKVNVPELQVVQLHTGMEVPVTTNVFPGEVFKGMVVFIAAKGDATLNYPVEIEISNSGKQLKAGMYGTAGFTLAEKEPVIYIPRSAFYAGVNSNSVFVMAEGKAEQRKVVSGAAYGELVEVKEGLSVGEQVIYSGQVNLVDGTPVVVQK